MGKYMTVLFLALSIYAPSSELQELKQEEPALILKVEDEYYYSDLIGLPVYNQDGIERGIVKEIKELPQCDYLYITYKGKNFYVPFLNEFILEVSDKIVLKEVEGLFYEN